MHKLLLVDDEQNVLHALQRELRGQFEVETFDDPTAALEHSKDTPFDLVIADYKMPGMNGLEFLKKFGQLQPDAARLVLSGEADIDVLVRTINETHIYRFLAKPWEKAELLSSIQQALAYRDSILESRRTADHKKPNIAPPSQDDTPYRIALVENDARLLSVMSRGLTDESGQNNIYGAMQQEVKQTSRGQKFKCEVETFPTAREALAFIEKNHCDLVIAAQTLPDMAGIQLLSKLRKTAPDTARILIGNDPDKSMLSQAINDAEVQNFLPLHWDNHERTDVRRQAWNLYQLKTAAIQAIASRELLRNIP
jgi:DNA-binding NtrC family response regulator